jgi:hypothetical protein
MQWCYCSWTQGTEWVHKYGLLLNQETKIKLGYDTACLGLQQAAKNVLKVRMSAVEKNDPMASGQPWCRLGY